MENFEVVLLVGPQGSGKTTLYLKYYSDYEYISQDTHGKELHFKGYELALQQGVTKIVVDRINHTRSQRQRYLSLAKEYGYDTKIHVISEPFNVCLNRILNRDSHPTLGKDKETAIKALTMFKNQYERPQLSEANVVIYPKNGDWHVLNLFEDKRYIVVGDVHGCYDELMSLLEKCKYNPSSDVVILTGDLVDRGPNSKAVIDFIRNNSNVYSVIGNHDNKFMRFLQGNPVNQLSLTETIKSCQEYIDSPIEKEKLHLFFKELPYMITLPNNYVVVHAGINPKYLTLHQTPEIMMYMNGLMPDGSMSKPFVTENVTWWWDIPRNDNTTILYGHTVTNENFYRGSSIALDGGCVFGGTLRAACITNNDEYIVEVSGINTPTKDDSVDDFFQRFEQYVDGGFLRKVISPCGKLVLFNYTDKCTFEKNWVAVTLNARGTVYELETGKTVATAFPKFFNFEELPTSKARNLLKKENFTAYEKVDGSLGIIYWYNNKWNINTRGSFTSDQALKGAELLNKYKLSVLPKDMTLLVEIIYPENKIIVDYGKEEKLVLLGAYQNGVDLDCELLDLAKLVEMPVPKQFKFNTIDDVINTQHGLDAKNEGFVVRFRDGYRVKFKSKEYLKVARILSNCSPLAFWKAMKNGKVDETILQSIPEEFREEQEQIVKELEMEYSKTENEIMTTMSLLGAIVDPMGNLPVNEYYKQVGLYLKSVDLKHSGVVFSVLRGLTEAKEKYIMKYIRPTNNSIGE